MVSEVRIPAKGLLAGLSGSLSSATCGCTSAFDVLQSATCP